MSDRTFRFDDNTLVATPKGSRGDFLQVTFREYDDKWPEMPNIVSLNRYCVPGRLDYYDFDYAPSHSSGIGSRVRYFTDMNISMTKALKMLEKDLNKPRVIKMLSDATAVRGTIGFARHFVNDLLESVGRGTKSYRACKKELDKREIAWEKECEARRIKRENDRLASLKLGQEVYLRKTLEGPKGTIERSMTTGKNVKVAGVDILEKTLTVKFGSNKATCGIRDIEIIEPEVKHD